VVRVPRGAPGGQEGARLPRASGPADRSRRLGRGEDPAPEGPGRHDRDGPVALDRFAVRVAPTPPRGGTSPPAAASPLRLVPHHRGAHPGTQAPRHPGTQAPRHPGTQAPRHALPHTCEWCFPFSGVRGPPETPPRIVPGWWHTEVQWAGTICWPTRWPDSKGEPGTPGTPRHLGGPREGDVGFPRQHPHGT
jgi:hypothetical protein